MYIFKIINKGIDVCVAHDSGGFTLSVNNVEVAHSNDYESIRDMAIKSSGVDL